MLHWWSGRELICSVKQYSKTMKLTRFMFDWYYIVPNFIEFFTLHFWHIRYWWFPFTIISPFIVSWQNWQKPFFGKIFFSCKKSICWPIVVSITTNRLMLIVKSILNFLSLPSERVLVKLLRKTNIYMNNCVQHNQVLGKNVLSGLVGEKGEKYICIAKLFRYLNRFNVCISLPFSYLAVLNINSCENQ